MNVWDYFKNLFQEAEKSSPSKPLIHEAIKRNEKELEKYAAWKTSLEHRRTIDWLIDQYAIWQVLPDDIHESILFLNTPSSKGFAIHFDNGKISPDQSGHLLDFIKEKVLALNYRPQVSDTRTWSEKKVVKTVDRYYLKPRTSKTPDGRIKQIFGNITLELLYKDNEPFNLKFRATAYNDRLYHPPQDFQVLMNGIFQ
ncbi:MAG: hypothetical protein AAFZ15_06000 [Bacteroidota bacterium]